MTFRPATPSSPPQAATTPIEPAEQAIENIGQSVEQAREDVASARQNALDQASSDAERAAINARFDQIDETVGEFANRIEGAIQSGNAQMAATFTQFLDRLDSKLGSAAEGGQGDTIGDDDIVSVEEIIGGIGDTLTEGASGAVDAASQAADAAATAVDEAPSRVHGFLRPLWGGKR